MPQSKELTAPELETITPERFVTDEQGYLYDCAFREHVIRRLSAAQLENAEALRAVSLAGKKVSQVFEANLQRVGLTHAQFKLLMAIRYGDKDGIHMHRIATWLGVTPRNITAIVDALEAMALLTRVPDPRDRRAFIVKLTPEGDERSAAALRVNDADQKRVLGALTPEEKSQLRHLCMKLVRAAEEPVPARR
jgi:DNA-binding MarR family transcriptional regulator